MILQQRLIGEGCSVHLVRPTLLVVDDDQYVVETLARLLTYFGFNVLAHSDPVQALAEIQQRDDIAVIVCDYEMPNVNGEELAIAAKRKNAATPVFILSGAYPPEREVHPWDGWFLKGAPITALVRKLNAVVPTVPAAIRDRKATPSTGTE